MRLIPDNSNEEIQQAEELAQGLKQTMESTVVATVPLMASRQEVGPDRQGLPESIVGEESVAKQLAEVKAELAELRDKQAQPGREHNLAIGGEPAAA